MSKVLDKVSKLLAKAENAGTPEEAEAFMAGAMKMASVNNIDLAIARMHQASKERVQEPEERRIQVNPYNRRHNRKHHLELAMAICDVNDVRYLIGGREYTLHAVGFPSDLDMVEALYTHLSVQMAVECDEALKRGDNRRTHMVPKVDRVPIPFEDRDWGGWDGKSRYYDEYPDEPETEYEEWVARGETDYNSYTGRYRKPYPPPKYTEVPVLDADGRQVFEERNVSMVDGRVFRGTFYAAFVARMRGRLWEIRRAVERDRGEVEEVPTTVTLALRDKKEEVDKAHDEQRAKVHHLGTYRGIEEDTRKWDHTGAADTAGREAAARVPIDQGREVR